MQLHQLGICIFGGLFITNELVMTSPNAVKKLFPLLTSKELLQEIERHGIYREIPSEEIIIDFGQYIKTVPLILSGRVKVVRQDDSGKELFLYYVYPGETCAMSLTCCLANQRSEIKAIAEEDTSLIAIPVFLAEHWLQQYPDWKNLVMQTYSVRFRDLLNTIDSIAFRKMDERLEEYLFAKKKATQSDVLNITHQEIATELGTSREVISRLLKQLERRGKIQLGRNRIRIIDL